jgi:3-deoxy-D-manno-octulosonate 8-phosphate phosphatase (KDO 8-P phosphatase)
MIYLEQNIKALCKRNGIEFDDFLNDMDADNVHELSIFDLQAVCEEYETDFQSLMFKPMFRNDLYGKKLSKIKLIVLDVDGVMTDGGMYFTENGDQFKKYNTKDGMGIQHLIKNGYQVAIISSGFKAEMVKARASMLGIQHCIVSRDPKIDLLRGLCKELSITLDEVAIIGDDINDLEVMRNVGVSAAPVDAVPVVKSQVDIILNTKGGQGCVREFIDAYLMKSPIE